MEQMQQFMSDYQRQKKMVRYCEEMGMPVSFSHQWDAGVAYIRATVRFEDNSLFKKGQLHRVYPYVVGAYRLYTWQTRKESTMRS